MVDETIHIESMPDLHTPILILGFSGWGNAMDISTGTVQYLVKRLHAAPFASIEGDPFYRYDESRPVVRIEHGFLKHVSVPGGTFYAVRFEKSAADLVLLDAMEPHLCWHRFVDSLFSLAERLGVSTVISLGSMYDQVLHTDRIISCIAGSDAFLQQLEKEGVHPISYQGPSSVHSLVHAEGERRKMRCLSLWAHCPYYIQGAMHYGILSRVAGLLAAIGDFPLDTMDLEEKWRQLDQQIQEMIETNPKLETLIARLRKSKTRGGFRPVDTPVEPDSTGGKVIDLRDFLDPKP